MELDRESLREAIGLLIESTEYATLKKAILANIKSKFPVRFVGELANLNILLDLAAASNASLANVFSIVERKRRTAPDTGKVEYQRSYMRQRRARLQTALEIEQLKTGKKLGSIARSAFNAATMAKWMAARDGYLATLGEMTWKQKNAAVSEFWERIDQQLENERIHVLMERKK